MRSIKTSLVLLLAALLTLAVACEGEKKDDDKEKDKEPEPTLVEFEKVGGISVEVPGEPRINEIGEQILVNTEKGTFAVQVAQQFQGKTIEEQKAHNEMASPTNYVEEELEDGFALTWENTGGLGDQTFTNYRVQVRRNIGGTDVWCEANEMEVEKRDFALEMCKALAKK